MRGVDAETAVYGVDINLSVYVRDQFYSDIIINRSDIIIYIIWIIVYYFAVDWCPEPPQINGGVVTTTGKRAGSTATYSCQNGFILFGDNVSNFKYNLDF